MKQIIQGVKTRPKLLGAFVMLAITSVGGWTHASESAIDTSEEFTAAMSKSDWDGVVNMMHPDALALMPELAKIIRAAEPTQRQIFSRAVYGVPPDLLEMFSSEDLLVAFLQTYASKRPELMPALASARQVTLGEVEEGDTVHVIARIAMDSDGITYSKVGVTSLRKHEGKWKVLLSGDVVGLIEGFRKETTKDKKTG